MKRLNELENTRAHKIFCERCVYSEVSVHDEPCSKCFGTDTKPFYAYREVTPFNPEDIIDLETE